MRSSVPLAGRRVLEDGSKQLIFRGETRYNKRGRHVKPFLGLTAITLCRREHSKRGIYAPLQGKARAGEETPMKKRSYRMEKLTLKVDGDDIYGVMCLPNEERETYPTVILSHGFGSNAQRHSI